MGDVVTMADVCFAPVVEMALAYGTNLDEKMGESEGARGYT